MKQLLKALQSKRGVSYLNIPDFDVDDLVQWLGPRLVQTSGQDYAIAQHKDNPTDCSDRTEYFDWHSDGLYCLQSPQFVLLHCLDAGNGSVSTELSSVATVLEKLDEDSLYTLGKLQSTYIGHNGSFVHPILTLKGMLLASRGYVTPLPGLSLEEQPSIRDITSTLSKLYILLDENAVAYHWAVGDTLIFNQYQYIHRRNSHVIDKARKLIRLWFT